MDKNKDLEEFKAKLDGKNKIFYKKPESNNYLTGQKEGLKSEEEANFEEGKSGLDDESDEPNFIKKDEKDSENKIEELVEEVKADLIKIGRKLSGIRPEGNQQRNLDRETGGMEAEKDKGISEKDAWDSRPEQIQKMIEDAQDLNNASKSSRQKGFIHVKKQQKKAEKSHEKAVEAVEAGFVANLNRMRKARLDNSNAFSSGKQNGGGGRGL